MKMCLNCAFWFEAIDTMKSSVYMIFTSYFLGKVAYQVNGFVQDCFKYVSLTVHQ